MFTDRQSRAITTTLAATVLAGAALLGARALLIALVVLVVAIAVGWPKLLDIPAWPVTSVILGAAGLGALAIVSAVNTSPYLRDLPMVIALALLFVFFGQLMRRDDRHGLVLAVSGSTTGLLVLVSVTGWLAASRDFGDLALVVTGAASLAAAAGASVTPIPGWRVALPSLGAGALIGAGVGWIFSDVGPLVGVGLGFVNGLVVVVMGALFHSILRRTDRLSGLTASLMPLALAGMVTYIAGKLAAVFL